MSYGHQRVKQKPSSEGGFVANERLGATQIDEAVGLITELHARFL